MSLCQPVIWSMAAILRDSTVVVVTATVVRTRPRAIPPAMLTMRKSTHGFLFVSHIWVAYGAPLGGPSDRRSSAIKQTLKFTSQQQSALVPFRQAANSTLYTKKVKKQEKEVRKYVSSTM